MNLDQLIPMENNPRGMDEHDFEELKKSIQKYGLVEPIIFNKRSGHVVGGHQRLSALKELGWKDASRHTKRMRILDS